MIVLNEVKVKYTTLDRLLEDQLNNIRYGMVHVVVDLKEVFRKVYRPGIIHTLGEETLKELTSDIINIVSHYRNYFHKYGKKSNYYFLYSGKECEIIRSVFPDYKEEHYQKTFKDSNKETASETIALTVELLQEILPRVANVTFIETSKYDEFVYTKFIKSKIRDNQLMYILSDDPMFVQLLDHNVSMINIKGAEKTKLITPDNFASEYFSYKDVIPVNLASTILSIGGVGRYNLHRVPNVGPYHAARIVHKYYKTGKLVNSNYTYFPLSEKDLDSSNKTEKNILDNIEKIKENYEIVNGNKILYPNIHDISLDLISRIPIQPKDYFLQLNTHVFTDYPLLLDMLFKGEDGYIT